MSPQTIAKLKALPEFQELVAFLKSEADKLNDLSQVSVSDDAAGIALNVFGRKAAKERLDAILAPILEAGDKPSGVDPQEFIV